MKDNSWILSEDLKVFERLWKIEKCQDEQGGFEARAEKSLTGLKLFILYFVFDWSDQNSSAS